MNIQGTDTYDTLSPTINKTVVQYSSTTLGFYSCTSSDWP